MVVNVVFSALPVSNGLLSLISIHPFFSPFFRQNLLPTHLLWLRPSPPSPTSRLSSPPLSPSCLVASSAVSSPSWRTAGRMEGRVPTAFLLVALTLGWTAAQSQNNFTRYARLPHRHPVVRIGHQWPLVHVFSPACSVLMWHVALTAYICLH